MHVCRVRRVCDVCTLLSSCISKKVGCVYRNVVGFHQIFAVSCIYDLATGVQWITRRQSTAKTTVGDSEKCRRTLPEKCQSSEVNANLVAHSWEHRSPSPLEQIQEDGRRIYVLPFTVPDCRFSFPFCDFRFWEHGKETIKYCCTFTNAIVLISWLSQFQCFCSVSVSYFTAYLMFASYCSGKKWINISN